MCVAGLVSGREQMEGIYKGMLRRDVAGDGVWSVLIRSCIRRHRGVDARGVRKRKEEAYKMMLERNA